MKGDDNHRICKTSCANVYPHYVTKAEKKGRTKALAKGRPMEKILRT